MVCPKFLAVLESVENQPCENLVFPVSDFADRNEYRVKRIVVEGELEEEVIGLEVGQIEDEEVDIA